MSATVDTGHGYRILRSFVPLPLVHDALRTVNLRLFAGVYEEHVHEYARTACWFPELTRHPTMRALRACFADLPGDPWTQILLQPPLPHDAARIEPVYHVDEQTPGTPFRWVVAVPLTRSGGVYGGLRFPHDDPRLMPGDAAVMDAACVHSGGVNESPHVRVAVYLRFGG